MNTATGSSSLYRSLSFRVGDAGHYSIASRTPACQRNESARSERQARRQQCIVVVEDEPDISELLSSLFDAEGYLVLTALDAATALRLVQSNHPDAITLDLGLPDRDGRQLLYDLKSDDSTRHIPVIVVSAYAGRLGRDDRRLVAAIVDKPFDVGDLLRITRDTLSTDCSPRA